MPSLGKTGLVLLVWWLCWAALHGWYLSWNWAPGIAIGESLVSTLLLAAISSGIFVAAGFSLQGARHYVYLLTGALLASGIWYGSVALIMPELFPGNPAYLAFLKASAPIRMVVGFFIIVVFALLGLVRQSYKELLDEKNRQLETNRLARESELLSLRSRLQPHFLFNTLHSVGALTVSDPPAARNMIHQLSEFLRGSLNKEDLQTLPLAEEIHHLKLYLEIEKVRFGNRLMTDIRMTDDILSSRIPAFLLQPLVENAIKFGLYDTLEPVCITLDFSRNGSGLSIRITNPFDPSTRNAVPGTGYGLKAVHRRLFLLYNRNDLLQTHSDHHQFVATLYLPDEPKI